jgi:hypothetical protein
VTGVGINQVDLTCPPAARGLQWQLVPVPGMPDFFQIKNQQTGQCIDADNNHLEPAGKVTPQACQSVNNQFWMLFK